MRVILLQDIDKLGKKHEIKEVADGYARNFLIPKKLAVLATPKELEKLKKRKELEEKIKKEKEKKIKDLAEKIDGLMIVFEEKTTPQGILHGAVDKKTIIKKLKEKGFEIEEDKINLEEPIKKIGKYEIEISFLPEIKSKIKLKIEAK